MDGEFHYRLIEISYNSERPNNILSNKVNKEMNKSIMNKCICV